jgi:hypothetical protein
MKRTARLLIRLYPANWRQRYGEEFETLLEDNPPALSGIFDLLRGAIKMQLSVPSFPKLALALSLGGLLAGFGISFLVSSRYVSTADLQFAPPIMDSESPGVHRNAAELFIQYQNEILSRTSLAGIIQDPRFDLYSKERSRMPLEDVIERMRHDIRITFAAAGAGGDYLPFHISFTYRDRNKAQTTVQALVTKFEDMNQINRRTQAIVRHNVESVEIYRLEMRIAALEKRLGMPASEHEPDSLSAPPPGIAIELEVLDPPSLPTHPTSPNRPRFMASGFAAGLVAAIVVAIVRRRPPLPLSAQTA